MICGWVLARAPAKVSEQSSTISGYLGSSSDDFDKAMARIPELAHQGNLAMIGKPIEGVTA
jgi:hypothetical protein